MLAQLHLILITAKPTNVPVISALTAYPLQAVRLATAYPLSALLATTLPSYGSSKQQYSFQNSLLAAVAVAALCLIVYYCHENHLFHPHLGAPPKWDSCTTKMGQDRPSRHYR